jgi:predicted RNA-binding protein with PIN domain
MYDETVQKMATANQRKGLSNAGLPTYSSGADRLLTQDLFISDTRQLIEILVATGDKAEAEKIRDQAVARLNDARLKSAVSDAENKIQKLSVPKNK